jgi:glycosyltransferase involved in cell wall biosynthesis
MRIPCDAIWRGGVDAERFHPSRRSVAMRLRLTGGRPDRPLLLYVGRLALEKRVDALHPLLGDLEHAALAIVGDGPERSRLERRFAGTHTVFTGFLEGEDLAAAYASADVFVMPSTTETLGFVVLEAMASGVPVVAADAGGVRDLVSHGENGLLFDPRQRKTVTGLVRSVLESRLLAAHLARQGRKTAENATWSAETSRLLRGYEEAVDRAQPRSMLARAWHTLRSASGS